jgi:predicted nucleotidyltransferase
MNVIGFAEVQEAAEQVMIVHDLTVPVVTLPGLTLLKLLAWVGRRPAGKKDAEDLLLLFRTYCDAGNSDRLFEEALPIMTACNYDKLRAGVRLLGVDVAGLVKPTTRNRVATILDDSRLMELLATEMSGFLGARENPVTFTHELVTEFITGFHQEKSAFSRKDP